jgi:hypothetical protein
MEIEGSLPCSQKPAMVPILSQMHPVHTFPPYFPKIHFNIIFPSMPKSSTRSFPFRFNDKKFVCYVFKICKFIRNMFDIANI